jgi:hypothetical protein
LSEGGDTLKRRLVNEDVEENQQIKTCFQDPMTTKGCRFAYRNGGHDARLPRIAMKVDDVGLHAASLAEQSRERKEKQAFRVRDPDHQSASKSHENDILRETGNREWRVRPK